MRLTQFSDYALRTLLYLGVHDDRLVPVVEVARSYRISHNHLAKVAGMLTELGVVEAVRGRGGGIRLAVPPGEVSVGWLVRQTEPDLHLVECFDRETDTCPITPACMLRSVLFEARKSFLDTLDRYTLADFLASRGRKQQLVQLWEGAAARSA
jgi:Rrf2 family transcriptional regulator, nitric oxide-sensitive transcriptional repressor